MSVAERTILRFVRAVFPNKHIPDIPFSGDPPVNVPSNVPEQARRAFGWGTIISQQYLNSTTNNGLQIEAPESGTIAYLITKTLTNRKLDLSAQPNTEKLKMAVTVVCKRGTQKTSGFKLNHNPSKANRERFKVYRKLATRAASLIINLTEEANQPDYSYPPCQPLVDEMKRIRTNS